MNYGKNKEGYWTADLFGMQVDDWLDAFDCLHPGWKACFEVCKYTIYLAPSPRPHIALTPPSAHLTLTPHPRFAPTSPSYYLP